MLLFSFCHVFFSHQHVQMITGPHEKKWCGKIFWGPFLNKILNFRANVHGEDIVPHKRNLDMIFFTCNSNLSEGFIKIGEKKSKSSRPTVHTYTLTQNLCTYWLLCGGCCGEWTQEALTTFFFYILYDYTLYI